MSLVRIDWHPDRRGLREFGLAILVGFTVIGSVFLWRGAETAAYVIYGVGGVVGLIGLSGRPVALPFYWVWMGIAFVLGNIMTRVVVAVVFFGVVTPIGVAQRLAGRDRLQLKKRDTDSYWIDLPEAPPPEKYERQF